MSRDVTRNPQTRFNQLSEEKGAIFKDWGGKLPIALIYPNSYYLGMSNLGIHTIYRLLNNHRQVVCERVFWERESNDKNLTPLSLESKRPLIDFAVLAFSISYELDYFNIAKILRAGGIPLYSRDRNERHPIIIAGGPCISANPMPVSSFFNCLCIGEAEPILTGMLPVLFDSINDNRQELLKSLASMPGIYVPDYHSGTPVVRQWAENLDDFPATSKIITPHTELGDLYLIEAERGCQRSCRFCLVGTTFSPMRFLSPDRLIEQAKQGFEKRKRVGLVGPAVSDHPRIDEILSRLLKMGAELSISSLRINSLTQNILNKLVTGKVRTITLAPEAGSQRLRQMIKKGISKDDILESVSKIATTDIKQLKLYFIIGLPSETDEDIAEIIKLALSCKTIIDRQKSGTRITLNITPFIPKAGTPFQWLPMASISTLNHRQALLKKSLPQMGIKLNCGSPAWSQVQGVLSRGDVRTAKILADIDEVSLAGWRHAVEKFQLDIKFYANQNWGTSQKLPWAIIDSAVKSDQLKRELMKALD